MVAAVCAEAFMQEIEYKKKMEEFAKKGKVIQERLSSQSISNEERESLELEYEKAFSGFQLCLRDMMISDAITKCEKAIEKKKLDSFGYIG